MALRFDRDKLCCFICLGLLKDPVTTPCGHSFCLSCVTSRWNEEEEEEEEEQEQEQQIYSCPECRQSFTPRPVLVRAKLADLMEQLKKTGVQAAPRRHCYAGAEDVACDVCTGRKLKAFKSCLGCVASYCETHLQPHFESAALRKHKLVEPCKKLQENLCPRHDEVMKIFCRSDQQLICYLCSMDEHKGHDTVSAAAERTERQRELEGSRLSIQQRVQTTEEDLKLLQQQVEAINRSADEAVEESQEIFTQLIRLMEQRRSEVKQQIRSQQETEVSRVKELQEKLEQEMAELKRRDAELKKLSLTEDPVQFLFSFPSLSHLGESTNLNTNPVWRFEDVTAAVSEARNKLQDLLSEGWRNISRRVTEVDVLLPQPEPETREEFLKYSRHITLDPSTVNTWLSLSDGNRKVTVRREEQRCSGHPDRFTDWLQVLSREGLTGRCYWEVERSGGGVSVAVAYKDISRTGNASGFGNNDKSWALGCFDITYYFRHNNIKTLLSGPRSSRVGVYLDHKAGTLSFYSVSESETMTLLHRVQTRFTQPLYAGFWVYWAGDAAELCELT